MASEEMIVPQEQLFSKSLKNWTRSSRRALNPTVHRGPGGTLRWPDDPSDVPGDGPQYWPEMTHKRRSVTRSSESLCARVPSHFPCSVLQGVIGRGLTFSVPPIEFEASPITFERRDQVLTSRAAWRPNLHGSRGLGSAHESCVIRLFAWLVVGCLVRAASDFNRRAVYNVFGILSSEAHLDRLAQGVLFPRCRPSDFVGPSGMGRSNIAPIAFCRWTRGRLQAVYNG
jgi:hypothetical protein